MQDKTSNPYKILSCIVNQGLYLRNFLTADPQILLPQQFLAIHTPDSMYVICNTVMLMPILQNY